MAEVPPKEFQNRGSLQYQFGSELLQLPVHLFRIKDVESQVNKAQPLDRLCWMLEPVRVGNNACELSAF